MHKIAIKELAYFICASGNLTNEYFSNKDLRMGTKCHDYLQSKYKYKLKIFSIYNITYKITLRKKYYSYDSFFLNIFTLI